MDRLFNLRMTRRQMLSIGRRLGADVPFFLYNINQAIADGRGDRIRSRPARRVCHFVLILDSKPLSTREVFQKSRLRTRREAFLTKESAAVRMLCAFLDRERTEEISSCFRNDLEDAAFQVRPAIKKRVKAALRHGLDTVNMSGSGPTLFSLLPRTRGAGTLVKELRQALPQSRIELVHTC